MNIQKLSAFIISKLALLETIGVLIRIFSFSLVSWLGPKSPFMFVWVFNLSDALLLTWCSTLKKDKPYILLNTFWILVGIVGILRAGGWLAS